MTGAGAGTTALDAPADRPASAAVADPSNGGRRGGLADVAGIRVGHHTATGGGYLTGTTVILAPDGGMVAGVDIRGGAPGTRETDLLSPTAAVERVHAIVLTGGSAYGLAAASGVADLLGERGIGFPVGPEPANVVPIVPAAVIFDLGRGGDFGARPGAEFGRAALAAALVATPAQIFAEGPIGAGTGACTGHFKGGIGQASGVLPDGSTVAVLVVANATGVPFDPVTGELLGARLLRPEDGPRPGVPSLTEAAQLREIAGRVTAGLAAASAAATAAAADSVVANSVAAISHTTLGVIATDATLTKAQCSKLAAIAQDGLARAINPVHTMFDGDLFFGVSTGIGPGPDTAGMFHLLSAAADVVTRAVTRSILAAETVTTPAGQWPGYLDIAPSSMEGVAR